MGKAKDPSLTKVTKDAAEAALQRLQLERKQKSMAITVNKKDELREAPHLLMRDGKGDRQTLRGYESLIDKGPVKT